MKLRSTVRANVLNRALFRGAFFAFLGSFLLLFPVFIPLTFLNSYGFFIFLIAFLLIGWGLYPYQKLKMLQMQPYEITFLKNKELIFKYKKNSTFRIRFKDISEIFYKDSPYIPGICINLKKSEIQAEKKCQKKQGCDLFLPYFNKNSFLEVVDRINQSPD